MHKPCTLPDLAEVPALTRQHGLLQRLQSVLLLDKRCLGAAVVGSLAEGRADALSDVDVVVYGEHGEAPALLRALSFVAADVHVVHRLEGAHDACSVYEKVILQDWSSYEVHVIEPPTRFRLRPPYLELVSRDGYLQTRVSDDKPIGRNMTKPFDNGDAGLAWELFNCIKWLRRGDFAFTAQFLQALGVELGRRGESRDTERVEQTNV